MFQNSRTHLPYRMPSTVSEHRPMPRTQWLHFRIHVTEYTLGSSLMQGFLFSREPTSPCGLALSCFLSLSQINEILKISKRQDCKKITSHGPLFRKLLEGVLFSKRGHRPKEELWNSYNKYEICRQVESSEENRLCPHGAEQEEASRKYFSVSGIDTCCKEKFRRGMRQGVRARDGGGGCSFKWWSVGGTGEVFDDLCRPGVQPVRVGSGG